MSIPTTFKAAVLPAVGKQHVVTDRSLEAPLEPGEIGIKVTATAINPVDWKIRDFQIFISTFPAVIGSDAAGEVVAVGPDTATDLAPGDRVFFQGILGRYDFSTFQQYCKMPAALLARTPSTITDDQAAGVSLAAVAGLVGFYDTTGQALPAPWDAGGDQVGRGKAVVVLGGSSSVGQYAIQLARLSGFERIVTNASTAHHEHLKTLGAHVVLDRATQSAPADFHAALAGLPLEFVFDSISAPDTQALGVDILDAAKPANGRVVVVQGVDAPAKARGEAKEPPAPVQQVMGMGSAPHLRYLSEPFFRHLGGDDGWLAKGLFVPNRPAVVPGGLAALETALAKNKTGVSGEKVVIRPFDA